MAAKTTGKSKETVLETETWVEMLYALFNDNEIRKLASMIHPKIQGFSTKNIGKAPLVLLRKKTLEQLKQTKNIAEWMQKWFSLTASKVKEANIDFEQFVQKSQLGDSYTPADAVGVVGVLYPAMFNTHKDSIQNNLQTGSHPLANLAIKKLTPKRALQVKALAWEDVTSAECYRMLIEESLDSPPIIEGSLKEWIQNKQSIETGEIAYIASTRMDEINKWPEGEKAIFLQMAFHDSQKVLWTMKDDLLQEKQELEHKDKTRERQLKRLEKQTSDKEANEAALKAKAMEIEKKLAETERQHKRELADLQAELQAFKQLQAMAEEAAAATARHKSLLVTEPDFVLLTRLAPEDFAGLLPAEQVITIKDLEELQWLQLTPGTQYLFIHSDTFSTKEQFVLDGFARTSQLTFKSVSGDTTAVTRQLIYFLEGAILHEIIA